MMMGRWLVEETNLNVNQDKSSIQMDQPKVTHREQSLYLSVSAVSASEANTNAFLFNIHRTRTITGSLSVTAGSSTRFALLLVLRALSS